MSESSPPRKRWVWLHSKDNVVVALADLQDGEAILLGDVHLVLKEPIESGHKFAVRDIHKDDPIVKYEETIGLAVMDISAGEHVHVHNVKSLRARSR